MSAQTHSLRHENSLLLWLHIFAKAQRSFGYKLFFRQCFFQWCHCSCYQKAENSDEIIIRLNEGANKTINKFSLTLGNGIEDAKEVFASEEYKGKAETKDGKLITSFKPYEIKSFALKLKSGEKVKAQKAVPIELPLDKNIITKQGKCGDYDYTVPFEIVPDEINSNGYKFIINKNGNNALTASAQR